MNMTFPAQLTVGSKPLGLWYDMPMIKRYLRKYLASQYMQCHHITTSRSLHKVPVPYIGRNIPIWVVAVP